MGLALKWFKRAIILSVALYLVYRVYVSAVDFLLMVLAASVLLFLFWFESDWRGGVRTLWGMARWFGRTIKLIVQNVWNRKRPLEGVFWQLPSWMRLGSRGSSVETKEVVVYRYVRPLDPLSSILNFMTLIFFVGLALSLFL